MSQIVKKERNSNLELYRVIVMLLIVAHHYVVNSGLTQVMEQDPFSADSTFLYLFGMWGKIGINCFVLITGYFMCTSQITVRKFLKLLLEVEFYKLLFYAIFVGTGYEAFSLTEFVKAMLPIRSVADNFVGCFLIFYLFIPFLTVIVQKIGREMHKKLLLLCLATYTGLSFFPFIIVKMNYVTWFSILFLLASYLRFYGNTGMLSKVKWGRWTTVFVIWSMLSVLIFPRIGIGWYFFVADSNAILAVLTSVCAFMYFKDLHVPQSRFINMMGASTFGVLLIHANSDTMRQWLWRDFLNNVGQYGTDTLVWHALGSVLAIFIVCVLIDQVRIHTLEKLVFKLIDKYLAKRQLK